MAIRIREVNGILVALCAARSMPLPGDIYLDDGVHYALTNKFARDFNEMYDLGLPHDQVAAEIVESEESNNSNREEWEIVYGLRQETHP